MGSRGVSILRAEEVGGGVPGPSNICPAPQALRARARGLPGASCPFLHPHPHPSELQSLCCPCTQSLGFVWFCAAWGVGRKGNMGGPAAPRSHLLGVHRLPLKGRPLPRSCAHFLRKALPLPLGLGLVCPAGREGHRARARLPHRQLFKLTLFLPFSEGDPCSLEACPGRVLGSQAPTSAVPPPAPPSLRQPLPRPRDVAPPRFISGISCHRAPRAAPQPTPGAVLFLKEPWFAWLGG